MFTETKNIVKKIILSKKFTILNLNSTFFFY